MASREQMIQDILSAQGQAKPSREQMIQDIMGSQGVASDIEDASKMSRFDAAKIGLEEGGTFGLRPVAAGIAGAAGGAYGELQRDVPGEGFLGKLKRSALSIPSNYQEARRGAVAEQKQASEDRPGYSMAGNLAGSALTLPFTAAKGLGGAISLGGKMGAAKAVSEAESIPEAIKDVVGGAALGGVTFGATKALEKGIPMVANAIGKGLKKTTVKLGSALTGETEKNIQNYIEKNKQINKIISDSGGEISVAADEARDRFSKEIQGYRQKLGTQIGEKLDKANAEKMIDVDPILQKLQSVKDRVNSKLNPESAGQIDELVNRVIDASGDTGKLSLKELHEVNQFLQDRAKGSYLKGGQFFVPGKDSQIAAKHAAREGKIILNSLAPDIKGINNQLSQLHKIEEDINKNLIKAGKPEAALLAAGGAKTGRNRVFLKKLGDIVGKDFLGEAESLASARAFTNPSLLPIDQTGKSATRLGVGALLGSLAGGGFNPITAGVGAAATSPFVLKQGVNLGIGAGNAVQGAYNPLARILEKAGSPQGQSMLIQSLGRGPIERRMNQIDKNKK